MAAFGETKGLGGEIKLFQPPQYSRDTEKWGDRTWQLKSYVALYKPIAGEVMSIIEDVAQAFTDQAVTEQVQYQLVELSMQLHYFLPQAPCQIERSSNRI